MISYIVQGPITKYTEDCLKSIRKLGGYIILSTWKGEVVKGLDYDELVQSDDPGQSIMEGRPSNVARQIVSTFEGLKKVKTPYVVKIRTDMAFSNDDFAKIYFERQVPRNPDFFILKDRVLILPTHNPRRNYKKPFHVSDWFFFGRTEDLINIFDIPFPDVSPLSAEKYIWTTFIRKHSDFIDDLQTSERYFANNVIMAPAKKIGVRSLKYLGKGYTQNPIWSDAGYYTENEWWTMCHNYASMEIPSRKNFLENAITYGLYGIKIIYKWIFS